jgi:nicotinamidase-related amidase
MTDPRTKRKHALLLIDFQRDFLRESGRMPRRKMRGVGL